MGFFLKFDGFKTVRFDRISRVWQNAGLARGFGSHPAAAATDGPGARAEADSSWRIPKLAGWFISWTIPNR